jgi:hypothetical protein
MGIVMWLRVQWDRVAAGLCIVLGALALLLGWVGTSSTPYVSEQLPYIVSGGLAGIFLLGVGAVLWLSADLRDEWRELRALRTLHDQRLGAPVVQAIALQPQPVPADPVDVRVAARTVEGPRARSRRQRAVDVTESMS